MKERLGKANLFRVKRKHSGILVAVLAIGRACCALCIEACSLTTAHDSHSDAGSSVFDQNALSEQGPLTLLCDCADLGLSCPTPLCVIDRVERTAEGNVALMGFKYVGEMSFWETSIDESGRVLSYVQAGDFSRRNAGFQSVRAGSSEYIVGYWYHDAVFDTGDPKCPELVREKNDILRGHILETHFGVYRLQGGVEFEELFQFEIPKSAAVGSIDVDLDGKTILIAGLVHDTHDPDLRNTWWAARFDLDGKPRWKSWYMFGDRELRPRSLEIRSLRDGGFILVGNIDDRMPKVAVVNLDGEGNVRWAKQYGTVDETREMNSVSVGGPQIEIVGYAGVKREQRFTWIAKIGEKGTLVEEVAYDLSSRNSPTAVMHTKDATFVGGVLNESSTPRSKSGLIFDSAEFYLMRLFLDGRPASCEACLTKGGSELRGLFMKGNGRVGVVGWNAGFFCERTAVPFVIEADPTFGFSAYPEKFLSCRSLNCIGKPLGTHAKDLVTGRSAGYEIRE